MDKIGAIGMAAHGISDIAMPGGAAARAIAPGAGFGEALTRALESVSAQSEKADALQRAFQMNDPNVTIEETMLSMQEASLSFQALVQVRNKLVAAYQDIMNMQV